MQPWWYFGSFWVIALSAESDFVLQEHEFLLVLAIVE